MSDLFRETIAGQLIRLATGGKFLTYPEERNPSIIEKYINPEKSGNLARFGSTQPKPLKKEPEKESEKECENESEKEKEEGVQSPLRSRSRNSSDTQVERDEQANNVLVNVSSGVQVDPEKGRDGDVVDWYGPDDPDVSISVLPELLS